MKRLLALLLLTTPLFAQTVNPNQIKPAATDDMWLHTVTAGAFPIWDKIPASQGVQFQTQVIPPIDGQYVVVYPTVGTITQDPLGQSVIGPQGGLFKWFCTGILCTIFNHMNANWSGFTLPSYVNPANVTAVYADAVTSGNPFPSGGLMPTGGSNTGQLKCSGMSGTNTLFPDYGTPSSPWGLVENSFHTSLAGADVSTASCNISLGDSNIITSGISVNVPAIRLLVYYTGPPPPARTAIDVAAPLAYNPATLTLSDDAVAALLAAVTSINGVTGAFTFTGSGVSCTSTTCTFAGGAGGSTIWSDLGSPAANLSLTMGANTSTFTFNATTGSADLFKLTDTTSNTGTGILFHTTTASGSTETPWQADANGVGFKIGADGALTGIGSSSVHGMTLPTGTIPSPTPSAAGIYSGPSGEVEISENGLSFSRVCTAANGSCATLAFTSASIIPISGTLSIAANACTAYTAISVSGISATSTLSAAFVSDSPTHVALLNGLVPIVAWDGASAEYQICNITTSAFSLSTGPAVNIKVTRIN